MTPTQLKQAISNFSMFYDVDALKDFLRIETLLKYPDGTSIEIFFKDNTMSNNGFLLTDLGQTTAWLMTAQVKAWTSKKRQNLLSEILKTSGVTQQGGSLELNVTAITEIPSAILKLAQCCSRVADLTFTKRTALQTLGREEVEEVISDLELPYEQDFEIQCNNRTVKVDFFVRASAKNSAILTLSSASTTSAHTMSNEIFSKWYDIRSANRTEERITIFDDRYDVYRDDDIARLSDFSTVIPMSDRRTLQDVLIA